MKNIGAALLKAQKTMGAALKDAKNPFFRSKYADLNSVIDAVIPVLNENNIIVLQPTTMIDGKLYVKTILLHTESGEQLESVIPVIVKVENDIQQIGSAVSYGRRYSLQSFVVLKAEDNDGETAVGRESSNKTEASSNKQDPKPFKLNRTAVEVQPTKGDDGL